MAFVNTDRGEFVNSALIVSLRRDSELYAFPSIDGSEGKETGWDLTVKMTDGSEHRISGHRAAEAKRLLELPEESVRRDKTEQRQACEIADDDSALVSPVEEEVVEKAYGVMKMEGRVNEEILQRRLGIGFAAASRALSIMTLRGYIADGRPGSDRETLVDLRLSSEAPELEWTDSSPPPSPLSGGTSNDDSDDRD